jgi:hypothetical protein
MEYVSTGDFQGAFGSFASDVTKHPETAHHFEFIAMSMLIELRNPTAQSMTRFIQGFR